MEILIPKITDLIDILIIAFILYKFIMLLRRVGGIQILVGLIAAVLIYFTASIMKLNMVSSLLGILKNYWIIV